ncbi:BrnT family toxin [Azospirillum sp. TSH20]|nr:BrnT family toxin [Azospirillum sp. TSH20]
MVVYTWRDGARRIISARKANGREQRAYHATLSGVAPQADG